jgi:hypothetical protein
LKCFLSKNINISRNNIVQTCHKKPVAIAENQLNISGKFIFEAREVISKLIQKFTCKKIVSSENTSLYLGSSSQNASTCVDIIVETTPMNRSIEKIHAHTEIYVFFVFE